jgi:transcriptional regulator with XRE-family HTH domain
MQSDSPPSLNARLIGIGISESYASLLANGHRRPSLSLALKIAAELGIPVEFWARAGGSGSNQEPQP